MQRSLPRISGWLIASDYPVEEECERSEIKFTMGREMSVWEKLKPFLPKFSPLSLSLSLSSLFAASSSSREDFAFGKRGFA